MESYEPDLVVFVDENDNNKEVTMEVLDYFFYEGDEYATLVEYDPDSKCRSCEDNSTCEGCAENNGEDEIVIMKVVPVGEDEEEFVPIDAKLAEKLIDLINSGAFDDEEDEE